MFSRDARVKVGSAGQRELKTMLETKYGFTCIETGQENWLPPEVHASVRFDNSDLMVRSVRYMPDLLCFSSRFRPCWIDAKINTVAGTPNFTLELACYQEQLARMSKGERVALAFKDTDGRWYANWATKLRINEDRRDRRHEAQGSMTPYLLIAKSSCDSLMAFVALGDRI